MRNRCPLNFPTYGLISSLLEGLIPFHKLVCEAEMWLNDDIQTPRSNKTTLRVISRSMLVGSEDFTYYARGNERPIEDMTSAMQIVADRDTPTRQCTKVAVSSSLPFARKTYQSVSSQLSTGVVLTDEIQTSLKILCQGINPIILNAVDEKQIFRTPALLLPL